ncbi:MAG: hypothetical protein JO091_05360 [Acidobacteriaceae bacterium]|nr:hypothetical protein [Acidobacteriaceae bacterium]
MTSAVPQRSPARTPVPDLPPSPKIIPALSDESIFYSNSLGAVLSNWIIIPGSDGHSQTILAIRRISEVKVVRFSHPGLLVIAGGLFLVAAAALRSKDGEGAEIPSALLAALFVLGYVGSRRASVSFALGADSVETMRSALSDAVEFGKAVQAARVRLARSLDQDAESSFAAAAS